MNPDFSELPLEIQYEYLLLAPYQNIIQYCRTSLFSKQICDNPSFWNRKALLDFKIPLQYAPEAPAPAQRYALLKRHYEMASQSLLLNLIKSGLLDQALELYSRFTPDYEDEEEIMIEILMTAVSTGRPDILSEFSKRIIPRYRDIARDPYFETIMMGRPDLTRILDQYYSVRADPELQEIFYSHIDSGDLPVIKYLEQFVRRDPEFELQTAFHSLHNATISYFSKLYPHLLQDPIVVNRLADAFVRSGDLRALQSLSERAGNLIDRQHLRQNPWLSRYPQIERFLDTI